MLVEILNVPSIQKNIIFKSFIVNSGMKMVFEDENAALMKNRDFMSKGCLERGFFKVECNYC